MEAILALEGGRIFRGRAIGARGESCGEVVFNTSMSGYQEVLTDPSYRGQIVAMTYPEIGNCGTNVQDAESDRPQVAGLVVREASLWPSNWRATQGLAQYLREHGTPAIAEVDTRALTRHIRAKGAMRAVLSSVDLDPASLVRKAESAPDINTHDLVAQVTCPGPFVWERPREGRWGTRLGPEDAAIRPHCAAFDLGIKRNILRMLWESGFDVTVIPGGTRADEVLALKPDAVFLSNGPGDPSVPEYLSREVRQLIGRVPVFGICLGHQILALALGAKTFKLKFGHRGANHPVRELRSGRVAITSQNHGYAVDPDSLPPGAEVTHVNLNDATLEGFALPSARLAAVQFHPEASPGPHDSHALFREFYTVVTGSQPVCGAGSADARVKDPGGGPAIAARVPIRSAARRLAVPDDRPGELPSSGPEDEP